MLLPLPWCFVFIVARGDGISPQVAVCLVQSSIYAPLNSDISCFKSLMTLVSIVAVA
jgi:hypothetical protein